VKAARADRADEFIELRHRKGPVYCPACGSDRVHRVKRKGLLREWIYPFFGLYPWECRDCRLTSMLHRRGRARRRGPAEKSESKT
jgi:transposase-like protein